MIHLLGVTIPYLISLSLSLSLSAAMEEAIKIFLSISLSESQARALLRNLKLTDGGSLSGKLQNNLGKIVLYWMGGVTQWEGRELVEALVITEGLGRHTVALCSQQGKGLPKVLTEERETWL